MKQGADEMRDPDFEVQEIMELEPQAEERGLWDALAEYKGY